MFRKTAKPRLAIVFFIIALIGLVSAVYGGVGDIELVSVSSTGQKSDGLSEVPSVSADGRYVAFKSDASNLVANDTNGVADIFVHDRLDGTTVRINVSSSGQECNCISDWPRISADGRFVAFYSEASNLVANDTNGAGDIFVHDRVNGTMELVTVSSGGQQGSAFSNPPSISADGRYVAYESSSSALVTNDTNSTWDIFVRDRVNGTTERVSISSSGAQSNGSSNVACMSSDGRYVSFQSQASNLVAGDTNNTWDIFLRDRVNGTTERVSISTAGAQSDGLSDWACISGDGRFVAFQSQATNLVAGDTNSVRDIFVHDRVSGTTDRVSLSNSGQEGDGDSQFPKISGGGRYIAFESLASNLVSNDTNFVSDIFLRDLVNGTTKRLSVSSNGEESVGNSFWASINATGRYVAFQSEAHNLIDTDTDSNSDVFIVDTRDAQPIPQGGGTVDLGTFDNGTSLDLTLPANAVDGPADIVFQAASGPGFPGAPRVILGNYFDLELVDSGAVGDARGVAVTTHCVYLPLVTGGSGSGSGTPSTPNCDSGNQGPQLVKSVTLKIVVPQSVLDGAGVSSAQQLGVKFYYYDEGAKKWKDGATTCSTPSTYNYPDAYTIELEICHFSRWSM